MFASVYFGYIDAMDDYSAITTVVASENRILAQSAADTHAPTIHEVCHSTYRQLLVPIGDLHVRAELTITDQQFAIFQEYFRKHRSNFPPFKVLIESDTGVAKFLELAEKRLRVADAPFQDFFEEVLIPNQSDRLLGMHLTEHGLSGYEHPAMTARLELTKEQVSQLRTLVTEEQKRRREKWTSPKFNENEEDLSALDLREFNHLPLANEVLTRAQREVLIPILRVTPQRTSQRLSLGF